MTISDTRAILAVDPAPFGLAYVFFERGELRDWGRRFGNPDDEKLLRAFEELIGRFGPDVLVLEDAGATRCERRPRMRHILRQFAAAAESNRARVVSVSRYLVRTFWRCEYGLRRKEEVAAALAGHFPELHSLAPRTRKPWLSEDSRAGIFDALTLLLFAFPPAVSR